MQEGDTCWFYATKRLANATGFKLEYSSAQERYELISNFRKTQSRLDSAVLVAATLLVENYSEYKIYLAAMVLLCIQRVLLESFKYSPKITQNIIPYITKKRALITRQLKDLKSSDLQLIQELVSRYRTYNTKSVTNDEESFKAIVRWLKRRNPYQSQLLECACVTADKLKSISSNESSVFSQDWSREPRKLIVHTTNPYLFDPLSKKNTKQNNSVIILGEDSFKETSHVELSVEQKQNLRHTYLKDFNNKITRETLNLFNMQIANFKTSEELRKQLKTHGSVIVSGYYGEEFYTNSAHLLKDQNGYYQTFGTRQLMGWTSREVKQIKEIDLEIEHMITIIGIKYNPENPNKSRVIFIDPVDASFPNEQRKAYSMSFERLCQNKSLRYSGDYLTAHYSASNNPPEKIYKQETQKTQMSTAESLVRFGLIASVGVIGAGAVYSACNHAFRS